MVEDEPIAHAQPNPSSVLPPATGLDRRFMSLLRMAVQEGIRSNVDLESVDLGEDDIHFHEFLTEVVRISRQTAEQQASPEVRPISSLYTARSFSSPEEMGRSIRAIRLFLHANERAAAQFECALVRIRGQIEAAYWEKRDLREFWLEVSRLFSDSFRFRAELLSLQRQWTEATVDLYEFVLTHSDELSFEGRLVRSREHESGRDFLQKLHTAKQYRDSFRRESCKVKDVSAAIAEKWVLDEPRA